MSEPEENVFIRSVLHSMDIEAFDPRVVDHLRNFVSSHAQQLVEEARVLVNHREGTAVEAHLLCTCY